MGPCLRALVLSAALATLLGCRGAEQEAPRDDVVRVPASSPGMLRAIELGAQSWPEGLALFNAVAPDKNKALLVKLAFDTPSGAREFMFAQVVGNTDTSYAAILQSTPINVPDWHPGDRLEFQNEDVLDWVLQVEGEPSRGAFTTCQIARHERPNGNAAKHLSNRPEDCAWVDEYERRHGLRI